MKRDMFLKFVAKIVIEKKVSKNYKATLRVVVICQKGRQTRKIVAKNMLKATSQNIFCRKIFGDKFLFLARHIHFNTTQNRKR